MFPQEWEDSFQQEAWSKEEIEEFLELFDGDIEESSSRESH